jgi:hypothetical protein
MTSTIYTVACFTRALVSPGYTPEQDDRWLDCLWGTYTSQKSAELTIFRDILEFPDHRNYKILYDEDISRIDEECGSDYAWNDYDREIMRAVITIKDHGIPVMEIATCLVKSEIIPESFFYDEEYEYPEEFQSATDREFQKKYAKEIKKYGSKTEEVRAEAVMARKYELRQNISQVEDWIFTTNYGWFLKSWATLPPYHPRLARRRCTTEDEDISSKEKWTNVLSEDECKDEINEPEQTINNSSLFADWVHGY